VNSQAISTETFALAPISGATESAARSAMSAARLAQARWAATPLRERLARVRELRRLIAEHALTLAEASASARQRPALESITAEVLPLAEACRFLEREAPSLLAPLRLGKRGLPLWLAGVRSEVHREPLGVVLVIGPGNYPLLLPGVQLVQALVAGNAVLLKPGVGGWSAARALIEIIHRAGFDSHLVALLPETTDAAIAAIAAGPDKVVFTGSAATGEKILAQLAPRLIPATMELSGCDAFIVRADADLDLVVKSLQFGLALNNGATCMAPKRVLVHRVVAAELEGRLARAFHRNLSFAPGVSPVSESGLRETVSTVSDCSEKAAEAAGDFASARYAGLKPGANETGGSFHRLLSEAVSQGAHFVTGGVSSDGTVRFPVILAGVEPPARLLQEDVFAPVLSLVTVANDAEAVARANDCPYALGASVFSRDEAAARTVANALNAGVVTINDVIVPSADPRLPFGGRKRSGFGVTRGPEGLLELTALKVVTLSRSKFRPALEPPHPQDEAMFQSYLELTHGRSPGRRFRALLTLFKSLSGRNKPTPSPSS
jgi:acyl-CoA reductase-like NAD-dependent aldehyde dehydrogenase